MRLTEEEKYMKEAIRQAHKAQKLQEVPIGCVIVKDGKIIARGYNRRNTDKNTLAHAELLAIRKASRAVGDWRLEECTMYIRWNRVRCVQERLCRRGFQGLSLGAAIPRQDALDQS